MKFSLIFSILFFPMLAFAEAQSVTGSEDASAEVMNFVEFLKKGGYIMYPLVGLSVVTVILIFFYILTVRRKSVVNDKFMTSAEALIRKRDYLGMVAYCGRENSAISRIAEKTLDFMTKNSGVSFKEVREVAEAEGSRQAGMLSQRISYLSDIGSLAPMIGLLGTVTGMIKAFSSMSQQLDEDKTKAIASSISEALITTASGLVIGIVAVLFYSWFRGRVRNYIAELEAASTHLMALLAAQSNRQATQPAPAPSLNSDALMADMQDGFLNSDDDFLAPIAETKRDIEGI